MDNQIPFLKRKPKIGIFDNILFWDIVRTLKISQKQVLQPELIENLDLKDECLSLYAKFCQYHHDQNFKKALARTFLNKIILVQVLMIFKGLITLTIPVLIKNILEFIEDENRNLNEGIMLVIFITLARIMNIFLGNHSTLQIEQLGYNATTVIQMELFQKSQRVSLLSNTGFSEGEIINLMQVDATKLETVGHDLAQIGSFPIQISVGLYLCARYIGISFLGGLGTILIGAIIELAFGKLYDKYQTLLMTAKDQRTKDTSEVFSQIKFVKVNSLEVFFKKRLNKLRETELGFLNKKLIVLSVDIFCGWMIPQMIRNATFGIYILLGNQLTTSVTFTIISLYQMINGPLLFLPTCISSLIEASVSLNRCAKYIYTDELDDKYLKEIYFQDNTAIQFQNANFIWSQSKPEELANLDKNKIEDQSKVEDTNVSKIILKDLNLSFEKGKVAIIIGDVGSGKSSLFASILNEMIGLDNSQIHIHGSIAYVAQKTWIQNGTVKENILFGEDYDNRRYQKAIHYACLEEDLKILLNNDQTMIGEKGINLSGGQKARIAIARALYADRDIYLLDDPISAVDASVGQFLMKECIMTYLKGKTVLLITHSLLYCQYADQIVWLDKGQVKYTGSYLEISENPDFKALFSSLKKHDADHEVIDEQDKSEKKQLIVKQYEQNTQVDDELMLEEDREEGEINQEVIQAFKQANGGSLSFLMIAILQFIQAGLVAFNPIWLGIWADQGDDVDNSYYLKIYFIVGIVYAVFAAFRNYVICSQNIKTSKNIHSQMIEILHAPQCQFFERIPQGRIMNRFTKDLDEIDINFYPELSQLYVQTTLIMLDIFYVIYAASWLQIFPLLIYFFISYHLQRYYMKASRELQRIQSITKSPIVSAFTESLTGQTTIRAFKKTNQFIYNQARLQDINRKIYLLQYRAQAWFNLFLGLLSFIVNISATIYCVFYEYDNPSRAALILVYNAYMDEDLATLVRQLSTVEKGMVAFERCLHFSKIPHEKTTQDMLYNWPHDGVIEYNNYSVKYRDNLPNALSDINIKIDKNLKTGIVGRTGAGKSTVTMTLLRLLEAAQGSILIDNVDISKLSLIQLRESITMIMQDATIFRGTLRENLDPQRLRTDEEIIEMCNKCCLTNILERNNLDSELQENGSNLSAGEKQLICICRAVLKKSKIVLIDEATANIDLQTEQLVQDTILKVFVDCTVITIAHRINTILHCDKIIVIDKGRIVEHGFTQDLLKDKQSQFYSIYQEAAKHQK